MASVAMLGLGAMGSRMAANLLKAGHAVTLWNRSSGRTERAVQLGATVATTPRAAAAGADFVVCMVRDDEASRAIWMDAATGALDGMPSHAIAVETSTITLTWARTLALACAERGIEFLDAPVSGSRDQAEHAQLIFLVGGASDVLARTMPVLSALGRSIHHVGLNGAGAALKLALNGLLGVQIAALGEVLGLLRRTGVDLAAAVNIMCETPVCSPVAKAAAASMLAANFAPMFTIELAEKDLEYLQKAAGPKTAVPIATAARLVFKRAIELGYGKENMTRVVQLYFDDGSYSLW